MAKAAMIAFTRVRILQLILTKTALPDSAGQNNRAATGRNPLEFVRPAVSGPLSESRGERQPGMRAVTGVVCRLAQNARKPAARTAAGSRSGARRFRRSPYPAA